MTSGGSSGTMRHPKKRAFLAAYVELGTILHAAKAAGINRNTHTIWLADPEYADAFEQAKDQAVEHLEREAIRRAVEGVEEPVFHKGEVVGTIRRYSDTLLIFTLKALRPDKYRDRFQMSAEVTHHNGDSDLDAEIGRLMEKLGRLEQGSSAVAINSPPRAITSGD